MCLLFSFPWPITGANRNVILSPKWMKAPFRAVRCSVEWVRKGRSLFYWPPRFAKFVFQLKRDFYIQFAILVVHNALYVFLSHLLCYFFFFALLLCQRPVPWRSYFTASSQRSATSLRCYTYTSLRSTSLLNSFCWNALRFTGTLYILKMNIDYSNINKNKIILFIMNLWPLHSLNGSFTKCDPENNSITSPEFNEFQPILQLVSSAR